MSGRGSIDFTRLAVPGVRSLKPYLPGKPIEELEREYGVTDIIKLASNENPLGASPKAIEAMKAELGELELYPDGGGFALKQALASHHDLTPANVTLGNGSNDVLVLLAEAFLQPGLEAVFSQYCFAVYPIATHAVGANAIEVPALGGDSVQAMGHDLGAMIDSIGAQTRIVFVANPNNPTGTWAETAELERFLETVPPETIVVVDEAYHEYSRALNIPDASRWVDRYENLVVCRTFSKAYGLAGIRMGYCLSSPQIADLLNRIRQPFNVNSLALAGACAALGDSEFIASSVRENATGLVQLREGLSALGYHCIPSAANFVLVDMGRPAEPINEYLLRAGIIVRPVANYGLPNHLRITVGTRDQNRKLLDALGSLEG